MLIPKITKISQHLQPIEVSSSNENITDQSLKGIFWLLSGKMGIAVLRILSIAFLARLLSPEDFGLVQGATVVTGFVEIFSMLGVGPALVQFKHISKEHISSAFTFSVAFGCFLSLLLWLSAGYVESFFQFNNLSEVLKALVLLFPIHSVSVVSQNLLYRKLEYQKVAKAEIIAFIGYAIAGVSFALFGWAYWSLVFAYYTSALIKSTILFLFQPHSIKPVIHFAAFSELFRFGSGITLSSFFNYLAMKGDYLIIGRFLGVNALGIYGRSYNLMASSVTLFGQVLDKVLFTAMSKKQDELAKLQLALKRSISIVALIVLPISIFSILMAPEIINIFLGEGWEEAIIPFQVLASTMVFRISYKMNGALARAKGLVFKLAGRQAFYAIAILAGTLIGQQYGLVGASVGVAFAFIAHYCYMTQLSLKILPGLNWFTIIKLYKPAFFICLLTNSTSFLVLEVMRAFLAYDMIILMGGSIWFLLIYAISIYLYSRYFFEEEVIWLIKTISKKIPVIIQKYHRV